MNVSLFPWKFSRSVLKSTVDIVPIDAYVGGNIVENKIILDDVNDSFKYADVYADHHEKDLNRYLVEPLLPGGSLVVRANEIIEA